MIALLVGSTICGIALSSGGASRVSLARARSPAGSRPRAMGRTSRWRSLLRPIAGLGKGFWRSPEGGYRFSRLHLPLGGRAAGRLAEAVAQIRCAAGQGSMPEEFPPYVTSLIRPIRKGTYGGNSFSHLPLPARPMGLGAYCPGRHFPLRSRGLDPQERVPLGRERWGESGTGTGRRPVAGPLIPPP